MHYVAIIDFNYSLVRGGTVRGKFLKISLKTLSRCQNQPAGHYLIGRSQHFKFVDPWGPRTA